MDDERESVSRAPHPRLRPFVQNYIGYRSAGYEPGIHAGLPSGTLTFVVSFDDPLDVTINPDGSERRTYWAMLAGLHAQPAFIHHQGHQHGVQLAVTPSGASALFGVPAASLTGHIENLDQVVPTFATELTDRLSNARSWRTRWAILDEILLREMQALDTPAPLEQAWQAMRHSHGTASIAELAAQSGWSRRHFTKLFSDHCGLTPKVMARVLRFERAQKMLRLPTAPSLASVAAACGYSDQAHMTREWTSFAGASPLSWMSNESIPILQDPTPNPDRK